MKFFLIFTLLPIASAYWNCPANQVLPNSTYFNVFPDGSDIFYAPNSTCKFQINIPNGLYAVLTVKTIPDVGDTVKGQNSYLNLDFFNDTYNVVAVGPVPFVFTIISAPYSRGTFQLGWTLKQVSFPNVQKLQVKQGDQPSVILTDDLFKSSRTISASNGGSISISTASYGTKWADYMLTGALVYQGDQPTETPIACLFNRILEITPLIVTGTVTLVFFSQPYDAGAFSISTGSDVANYAFYRFLYYDSLGTAGRFVVDATNGTAAVTLFQNDQKFDTVLSYIISDASNNFSIYAGGLPLSPSNLLSTYGVYATADNAMPQWIPGKLKTFYLDRGTVSIITNPNSSDILPARDNLIGFYKSSNYPFSDIVQNNSLYFQSSIPLILTLSSVAFDASTQIIVNTTGIDVSQKCILSSSSQNCSLFGTNFLFASTSTKLPSSGGIINYYFASNYTTTKFSSKLAISRDATLIFILILLLLGH